MFISIHIPKTAGTSLAYIFDHGSGRRIMYDYKANAVENLMMDDLAWWTQHKPFLERQFDFIHGHFSYRKYAELFPDGRFMTWLRHPVDRIISQFNHLCLDADPESEHYRAIVEDGLDVVDFAACDGVRNAQAGHLEGREIEDYDFVFISEWIDLSLSAFEAWGPFVRNDPYMSGTPADGELPRLNVRSQKIDVVTQAMRQRIYSIAVEDVEVYLRACEGSKQLIRNAGVSH